jgi:hypothetical protein
MDQCNLPSDKTSRAMEARVRSMVNAIQKEFNVSAGAIFLAFMLVLLDIDQADVTTHMEIYKKIL